MFFPTKINRITHLKFLVLVGLYKINLRQIHILLCYSYVFLSLNFYFGAQSIQVNDTIFMVSQ
jgi:hypothetical protein